MKEPLIVTWGRSSIDRYTVDEYEAALTKAFGGFGADFIVLDDLMTGQRFQAACVAWAVDQKLLYCSQTEIGDQSVVSAFRLTKAGEKRFKKDAT